MKSELKGCYVVKHFYPNEIKVINKLDEDEATQEFEKTFTVKITREQGE